MEKLETVRSELRAIGLGKVAEVIEKQDAAIRCLSAALRDYDGELDALSHLVKDGDDTVDAQYMAKQDLPIIRKRHAEALRLAGH